jgi:hypothetical protein
LQRTQVRPALAQPLFQRGKSGIGEKLSDARHGQFSASALGMTESNAVVVQRALEVLA